jgi:hypothetical protein
MSDDRWRTRLRWVVVHPQDPAAGVQRATLLAVPREAPAPAQGMAWVGRAGLAGAGAGDVWFKTNTTSPLFVNEGVVMGALAGLFPGQVPAPRAVEPERGWMVLADFGEEVGWEAPMEVVEEVAQTYARMQVEATAGLPGVDAATWLSPDEEAGLRAAVPGLQALRPPQRPVAPPPGTARPGAAPQRAARRPGRPRPQAGRRRGRPGRLPQAGPGAARGRCPFTPVAGPNWLPPELERLRDFHLPGDAASRRPRRPRRPRPRPGRPCR